MDHNFMSLKLKELMSLIDQDIPGDQIDVRYY